MRFDFLRQASNSRPCFKFNLDSSPFHEVFDVPAQTSCKAEFIKYQRMKYVRKSKDLFQALLTKREALREYDLRRLRRLPSFVQRTEVDGDRRDVLCGHFMKLSSDPPPLIISLLKQLRREPL